MLPPLKSSPQIGRAGLPVPNRGPDQPPIADAVSSKTISSIAVWLPDCDVMARRPTTLACGETQFRQQTLCIAAPIIRFLFQVHGA